MKKLITVALLAISTVLSAQSVYIIQPKPKPAQVTLRMNYGLKQKAGFSTEVLLPTQRRVLLGLNIMFDSKERNELDNKNLYSSGFMLGFEVLPNIIIGGKAGWSVRESKQGVLISQTSKSQTQSYGPYSTTYTTTDNVYDTKPVNVLPTLGGFITTTTPLSPFVAYDTFSGVTFGLGVSLK